MRKLACPECLDKPYLDRLDGWSRDDGATVRVYECPCCHEQWKITWPAPDGVHVHVDGAPKCLRPHVTIERTSKRYVQERG